MLGEKVPMVPRYVVAEWFTPIHHHRSGPVALRRDHFVGEGLRPVNHRFSLQSAEYPPLASTKFLNPKLFWLPKTNDVTNPTTVMPTDSTQNPIA